MFNIFFLCFFAIVVGLVLAVFITRKKNLEPTPHRIPEQDYTRDPKDIRTLTLNDLEQIAQRLCQNNGLNLKEKMILNAQESYWIAESTNEFFWGNYVIGLNVATQENPFVTLQKLLEFKDFVKGAGTNKGFYFTTGYFTRDVHQPLEGPKITLYNRLKILEELNRLGIAIGTARPA